VQNATDGEDYTANFTVYENGLADDNQTVQTNFSTVEADAELDTVNVDGDDWVVVAPEEGQNLTGETNVAPGTEVTVFMQSTESSSPFLINPTVDVAPDGTIEVTTPRSARTTI
jgi:hypothetical protein